MKGVKGTNFQSSNELWGNNVNIFKNHVWSNYWVSGTELQKKDFRVTISFSKCFSGLLDSTFFFFFLNEAPGGLPRSVIKNPPAIGGLGLIPGLGRSPRGGSGNLL